jgi:hypothetical protein
MPFDLFSASGCLRCVQDLLFLSMTVSSLQHLFNAKAYGSGGLFDWQMQQYVYPIKGLDAPVFEVLLGRAGFILLHLARVGLMVTVVALDEARPLAASYLAPLVMTVLFGLNGALYLRSFLTVTAADQLNSILLFCLTACRWFPSARFETLSLCAMAAQVLFCYLSNGLIKALEPGWRDGTSLRSILQTEDYSRKVLAGVAEKIDLRLFRLLSYVVIVWEIGAVTTPFLPRVEVWVYLSMGVLFHLVVALVMGLNTFFWTFLSTYPAILFLNALVGDLFR